MEKWKGKYRIPSARATWWDYSGEGVYFIIICSHRQELVFGDCQDGKMTLSVTGAIAQGMWYMMPSRFPHVTLDAFVVMPNHIHGILIFDTPPRSASQKQIQAYDAEKDPTKSEFFSRISPKAGSLGRVLGWYKSECTKRIREVYLETEEVWQERYWDNIIQNAASFERIATYIETNPANWEKDKFYRK